MPPPGRERGRKRSGGHTITPEGIRRIRVGFHTTPPDGGGRRGGFTPLLQRESVSKVSKMFYVCCIYYSFLCEKGVRGERGGISHHSSHLGQEEDDGVVHHSSRGEARRSGG